jgi:hypothetical protein
MEDLLKLALCGQTVIITQQQLIDAFECSFDQEPSFCCTADLQSWCDTQNLQLTILPDTTFQIST